MKERLAGVVNDPAALGLLMAAVYAVASLAQLVVGWLLDRFPLKRIYIAILALQPPLFLLAAHAQGWQLYALQILFMIAVFGAIPFTDVLIARYVDDRMRSRVAGDAARRFAGREFGRGGAAGARGQGRGISGAARSARRHRGVHARHRHVPAG